jgi:hypothetical protein
MMLATNCACCGKALVDSISVQTGVGPECRKRHGYNSDVPEAVRQVANKAIYMIAVAVSTNAVTAKTVALAVSLTDLGFPKIAEIVARRLTTVSIEEVEGTYQVRVPYSPDFNQASWTPGRKGLKLPAAEGKKRQPFVWRFPRTAAARKALWAALSAAFPGALGIGPKGAFTVPS